MSPRARGEPYAPSEAPGGGRAAPRAAPSPGNTGATAPCRPPGEVSTIVNIRLPLSLVARLDDYLDRLEEQTGLKANRGMIARRALELFLATHQDEASPSARAGRPSGPDEPAVPVRRRRTSARPTAR
jgi:hypothetical protein